MVLLVGAHVLDDAGHPADILVGKGIGQLEDVVLFGNADVLLNEAVADLSPLGQGDEQLVHLAGNLLEVVAEVFGEQLGGAGVDLPLSRGHIPLNPLGQLVVAHLVGLEHDPGLLDTLDRGEPLVRHLVAVDEHEDRGGHRIVRVGRKLLELVLGFPFAQILSLLHEDQPTLRHHRKLPGCGQHLVEVAVPTIENGLVEIPLVLLHGVRLDGVGQHIEVIGLLPSQQIERGKLARLDGAQEVPHPLHDQENAGAT